MDIKVKSEELSKRFNKITEKFANDLNTSTELQLTGDDLIESIEASDVTEISNDLTDEVITNVINLQNLINDFAYIRSVLKENTDNGRKLINNLSLEILSGGSDLEILVPLIQSFSDLNRSLTENMKLFIQSYKEISNVILNINKAKSALKSSVTNNLNISTVNQFENGQDVNTVITSTADLINKLREQKKE